MDAAVIIGSLVDVWYSTSFSIFWNVSASLLALIALPIVEGGAFPVPNRNMYFHARRRGSERSSLIYGRQSTSGTVILRGSHGMDGSKRGDVKFNGVGCVDGVDGVGTEFNDAIISLISFPPRLGIMKVKSLLYVRYGYSILNEAFL